MDEMVMVGRRQDNTLTPSVSGHLHYDGNEKGQRKTYKSDREREKADTRLID